MTTDKPKTKTPTLEERGLLEDGVFRAFKKVCTSTRGHRLQFTRMSFGERCEWEMFCAGYFAAAKAEKTEISDEKIDELIKLTCTVIQPGDLVWGRPDTQNGVGCFIGTLSTVTAKIRKILEAKEEEKKEEKK